MLLQVNILYFGCVRCISKSAFVAGTGGGGGPRYSNMDQPTTIAEIYDPSMPVGQRWKTVGDSQIPRLYHSTALLTANATVSSLVWNASSQGRECKRHLASLVRLSLRVFMLEVFWQRFAEYFVPAPGAHCRQRDLVRPSRPDLDSRLPAFGQAPPGHQQRRIGAVVQRDGDRLLL